jgi:hypothetical protein
MPCAATSPADGPGWAEEARCLEGRRLSHAAARAWRHAWEADPTLAERALPAAAAYAHRSGDDGLLVDVAAALPAVTDLDVAGHLALARAVPGALDERELLASVPSESCRYPYAQHRIASLFHAEGKLRSEVGALRSVMISGRFAPDSLGRAPLWESWTLADAALLQVVSVYAGLGRPTQVTTYAAGGLVRKGDPVTPYGEHALAWAAARSGDREAADVHAALASEVLPEASVVRVAVAEGGERAARAEAAHAFWDPIRTELAAFEVGEDVRRSLLALDAPQETWGAGGALGPMLAMWIRSYELEREARRAKRDPVAAALVEEARDELERVFGGAVLAAMERGLERIDASTALIDELVADPELDARSVPLSWRPGDLGW